MDEESDEERAAVGSDASEPREPRRIVRSGRETLSRALRGYRPSRPAIGFVLVLAALIFVLTTWVGPMLVYKYNIGQSTIRQSLVAVRIGSSARNLATFSKPGFTMALLDGGDFDYPVYEHRAVDPPGWLVRYTPDVPLRDRHCLFVQAHGWPFRSITSKVLWRLEGRSLVTVTYEPAGYLFLGKADLGPSNGFPSPGLPPAQDGVVGIPFHPYWPGIAGNLACACIVASAIVMTPAVLRSMRRIGRRCCMKCGYTLDAGMAVCPECGSSVPV